MTTPKLLQGSLFEEDFLVRTLGTISHVPDVALTELVANAWDAGASQVRITIPDQRGDELRIEDDGTGMTPAQFKQRWMTLGYDRLKHQGKYAEYPPEHEGAKRHAYGHNGVGRHGMLCFADEYVVETRVDGKGGRYTVATASGSEPFALIKEERLVKPGHGTRLSAKVARNLPDCERIRGVLAARFLYDPRFRVVVNDKIVPLHEHAGLREQRTLTIGPGLSAEVSCIDSTEAGRTGQQHGIAFWVGNRLVGEPSWTVGGMLLLDGRRKLAKRLTFVVSLGEDMFDHVESDWSAFKPGELTNRLYEVVSDYVSDVTRRLLRDHVEETKVSVLAPHRARLEELQPLARREVEEFVQEVAFTQPTIAPEMLSAATQALINLEETRSGKALLERLSKLSPEDVEGLNRLLNEWTVRDALTILDEIGRRIRVVEALEKLVADPSIDELATIHPLVTQARWLFGPDYESPLFTSNVTIRKVVEKVWGVSAPPASFVNAKNRPDLVFLADRTVSAVATEDDVLDESKALVSLQRVLIIELKRGASTIGRQEMDQATGYVEDLLAPGLLDGSPKVNAFVVGHTVDNRVQRRDLAEGRGRVEPCTFDRLVRTAGVRLFRLRDRVSEQYDLSGAELADRLREQGDLFAKPADKAPTGSTSTADG
jgi:hypothetical protein